MNGVPRWLLSAGTLVALAAAPGANAAAPAAIDEEEPAVPPAAPSGSAATAARDVIPRWADDAPAGMDAPQIRNLEPRTRLYVDGSFAQTPDLSALPYIAGKGRNVRVAIGGSYRRGRFQFDTELPASQATTLDLVDPNTAIHVLEEDRHQTSLSIGDLRLGAQWTDALPVDVMTLLGGFGLRVRVPTHTPRFQFTNTNDNTLNTYVLPYYFHIEPALLFGGAAGPLSFVMNQGAMILIGPDGMLQDLPIIVPTIYFWDAHYALACRIFEPLSISVEVNTTVQLNELDPVMFPKLSHVRAVSVIPDIQIHVGRNYRVDAAARFGVTRGADVVGVLGYGGSRSAMLRVTRTFD